MTNDYLDKMTRAYLVCALWASTHFGESMRLPNGDVVNDGENLNDHFDVDDIPADEIAIAREDCADFLLANVALLRECKMRAAYCADQCGMDFWLSRNGHGAGFFDRGLAHGATLHSAAKVYGSRDLFIGADFLVHGF